MLWVGVPAWRQISAIREVQRLGGEIDEFDIRRIHPTWLRSLIGDERMMAFDEIHDIQFHPDEATVDRYVDRFTFV